MQLLTPTFIRCARCWAILAVGKYQLGFDIDRLRTLTLLTLLFNGQAVFYIVRERRRLWSSWPSPIVIASCPLQT